MLKSKIRRLRRWLAKKLNPPAKPEQLDEPSGHFARAFCGGGTIRAECGFCGRENFTTERSGWDWEEGEQEELFRLEAKYPDRYVSHNYDSVTVGDLAGTWFVWDCPCNQGRRYENFVWDYRHQILRYIRERSAEISRDAKHDATEVAESDKAHERAAETVPEPQPSIDAPFVEDGH